LDRAYYQCHRSYIINFRHIAKIDSFRGMAILNNGQEIPISFRRRRDTYRLYDEYTENKA
jgi:DNA-binding LytR/AlgR family response regulator